MKKLILIMVLLCINCTSSLSQYQRYQKIVGGEYVINSDLGEGNGTWFATDTLSEVNVIIPGINLPVGSKLYIRFKSTNGTWSGPRCIVRKDSTFTNSNARLAYGEYYINTDHGNGNGIPIAINPDGSMILDQPKIKRGDKVYFRVKDSFNRWSPARPATFRFKDITKADYYISRVGGTQTLPVSMLMSAVNDSSTLFIAQKDSVPARTNDTVYVRFQTYDHFISKWYSAVEPYQVNVKEDGTHSLPTQYSLSQNYPNPFNPSTTIKYALPQASHVDLSVFNTLGQRVVFLVDGKLEAGYHEVKFDASGFTSGVYFYRLQAGEFTETKKLILMK